MDRTDDVLEMVAQVRSIKFDFAFPCIFYGRKVIRQVGLTVLKIEIDNPGPKKCNHNLNL